MKFLFEQKEPFVRLLRVRHALCLIVLILLSCGPYDSFYVDMAPVLFQTKSGFLCLGFHFWTLKACVMLTCACFGMGLKEKITGPIFALSFLAFNYYITCFGTTYWITNTHLNFFAFAVSISAFLNQNRKQDRELASFLLAFMITYIATLYLQAGLSKCIWGGLTWFTTGKRILVETLLLGTTFGKWLTNWPALFSLMGIVTFAIELIVPFFFFFERTQKIAACAMILFHLGTFVVMGISFWFLWSLYPALFSGHWREFFGERDWA